MSMDNGVSWIPSPGVVPVIRRRARMNNSGQWVQKRMLSSPEREAARDAVTDMACVSELGWLALKSGAAERMEVWSCDAVRTLGNVLLLGNSALPSHRWTLSRDMLEEKAPAWLTAFPDAVLEDPLNRAEQLVLKGILEEVEFPGGEVFPGGGSPWVAADFKRPLRLEDLPHLNGAAKARGMVLLAHAELEDVQGNPLVPESYPALAMQLAVERGVDFTRCAGALVVVEETTDGGSEGWGRILRAEGDGAPIPLTWPMGTEQERPIGGDGR